MKNIITTLSMLLACTTASAEDFTYTYQGQTLTYTVIDEEAKTCKTKDGYVDKYYKPYPGNKVSGSVYIPDEVKNGRYTYKVVELGQWAFYENRDLTEIALPETITSIPDDAFNGCSSLTGIYHKVSSIGNRAFKDCINLTDIVCDDEASVRLSTVYTGIGDWAFQNCSSLKSFVIPKGISSIGTGTFSGCSSLTDVFIHNEVETIGRYAFQDCSNLEYIRIPKSIHSIGAYAFSGCSGLTRIDFVPSYEDYIIRYIDEYAFSGCTKLAEISNFYDYLMGYVIGKHAFSNCSSLTSVIINSESPIEESTFEGCKSLTSATILNIKSSIGKNAFSGCSNLASITISDIKSIEENAFSGCSSLTSFVIPATVTSIGNGAFSGCTNLKEIISLAHTAPNSSTAFSNDIYEKALLVYEPGQDVDESYGDKSNEWWKFGKYEQRDLSAYYITLNKNTLNLHINSYEELTTYGVGVTSPVVKWSSLDTSVATVNEYGRVVGIGVGETDIIATVEGNDKAEARCHVTVGDSPEVYLRFSYDDSDATATVIGLAQSFPREIVIPETTMYNGREYTVTSIGSNAFSCFNKRSRDLIDEITLPSTITNIAEGAFMYNGFETVHYGPKELEWDTYYYYHTPFCDWYWSVDVNWKGNIEILETVRKISSCIFMSTPIRTIVIPDNVEEVSLSCFASCLNLKEIHIGKGLKELSSFAFGLKSDEEAPATTLYFNAVSLAEYFAGPFSNRNLVKIVFGNEVESLPSGAFEECNKLEDIYCNSITPPVLESRCFYSANKETCTLHVMPGTKELYQKSYIWQDFLHIVEDATGIDDINIDKAEGYDTIYNLNGQKLDIANAKLLPKGVYIVNGKKRLVK